MNEAYRKHCEQRAALGVPPLPLDAEQAREVCERLKNPAPGEETELLGLLTQRVPPGVDPAAEVKASFLTQIGRGEITSPLINRQLAVELLGTMLGGYNLNPLISFLSDPAVAETAAQALAQTLLVFDAYHEVIELAQGGNRAAAKVIEAWSEAQWLTARPPLPARLAVTVYKVDGEINTDDLSPAIHAVSRADIPRHALSMGEKRFPEGIAAIAQMRARGEQVAFVGDVVGTGSSRKSATNSLLWHIGEDIAFIPNKRRGGIVIGAALAPIFFNTLEDSGALPIQCDVSRLETGQKIIVYPLEGKITDEAGGQILATFELRPNTLPDEYRAGGRVPLIIGRTLTGNVRQAIKREPSPVFIAPLMPAGEGAGLTLAQKIIARACGVAGVYPGTSCTPRITTVGSQDTTGPMTRSEMIELACLGFSADFVLQSFCHTAAYPKPADLQTQATLPSFIVERGGVSLKPGDGIIHSWLNRMLLPDTVGTGGDSHTRFPIGLSFPAGSGLVAFAAALGVMPLEVPESVLVRFSGQLQPGLTLRDVVNAIPYFAIQAGLLTVAAKDKKNVFNGRILEIEGLPELKIEQAFELSDASAERSAAGCTIALGARPIKEYLRSNITLLGSMIADGYQSAKTLRRRIERMEEWLNHPELLRRDGNARFAATLDIDLAQIREPLLACPNNPDDVRPLSEVAGDPVQEVFIGSCMTNIGHYRAAARILKQAPVVPVRLWICPPTRMDEQQLRAEGVYDIFNAVQARCEIPGCSLCMGNQARVEAGATVFSTSTRNFEGRMGDRARVYLGSAELAAVVAMLGRLPTVEEYMAAARGKLAPLSGEIYRYLNFDQIKEYRDKAKEVASGPSHQK